MIKVEIVDKKIWVEEFSENAHRAVFAKIKPKAFDRIDFAVLMLDGETNNLVGYFTCREFDHETLYIQYGGTVPECRGERRSVEAFSEALKWAGTVYKRATLLVENDNKPMLALAMKTDFVITGVRGFQGNILVEHTREF